MPRYTYLYENRMFTNKIRCSIVWVGKEDRVAIIKSLIYTRIGRGAQSKEIKNGN
jgi:hypothetical protein